MNPILEDVSLRDRLGVFRDRSEAGQALARFLGEHRPPRSAVVCAIPAGGVPVGAELSLSFHFPFLPAVVRKVQIPWNPEAGFGAITWDGEVVINRNLVTSLGLEEREIEEAIGRARQSVQERMAAYGQEGGLPDLAGRRVLLTDDGLASGYTMLAAIGALRRQTPEEVVVAVPTGSLSAVARVAEQAECICLNIRTGPTFAVADAYRRWHDLTLDEVRGYLQRLKTAGLWDRQE